MLNAGKDTPIFIISRDRVTPLKAQIDWFLGAGYRNLIVVDNDSTYPPLRDYYDSIKGTVKLIELDENVGPWKFWDLGIIESLQVAEPFVVTDPDVVPDENCPSDPIEHFGRLLGEHPEVYKIGFSLRIDDLPDCYRFHREVRIWELPNWSKPIGDELYDAPVDTTFALYRPHVAFDISGYRTAMPYTARHLPWYTDSAHPTEEEIYYQTHAKDTATTWRHNGISEEMKRTIYMRVHGIPAAQELSSARGRRFAVWWETMLKNKIAEE